MRLLIVVAVLFALLPLWPAQQERVEKRQRFFPSGQLKEDAEALVIPGEEPIFHGEVKHYREDGQLSLSGRYNMGKMSGKWSFWNGKGELTAEGVYNEDLGEMTNYRPDGSIQTRGPMNKLIRMGDWVEWFPSGRKRMQGAFVDGQQHGPWRYWSDEENPREISVIYKHGVRQP